MKCLQNTIITPLTTEQINKISSIEINDIKLLQDPKMGSQMDKCGTCGNFSNNCVGHYGHIPLPFPVFQPLLQQQYQPLLELVCLNCLKLPVSSQNGDIFQQIRSIRQPNKKEKYKCPHCAHVLENLQIEYLERGKVKTKIPLHIKCTKFQAYIIKKILTGEDQISNGSDEVVILSLKYVDKILRQLMTQSEARLLVSNPRSFDCFMIQSIPVPPNSLRVLSQQTQSHAMNAVYGTIISSIQQLSKQNIFVDDLYLAPLEKYPQIQYNRIVIGSRVVLYKDTSRNSKPQIKQLLLDLLSVSTQEPASALSQCLAKKGLFRQNISSVRVGMSARTVVVGDPGLDIDQVSIPKFFAKNLFMPTIVNNDNIEKIKGLISNYPNYPCAMRRVVNKITYSITEENKYMQSTQCNLGDVVMVQLMDGDVVLVQRYPTLREESFTAMRVKVEDSKAIKLPLSVIAKQGADFDGDEMEIFVLPSKSDCMEAIGCLSSCSQFITYETGLNLIGANVGIQNVAPGIFHLQNEDFKNKHFMDVTNKNDNEKITGIELIQKVFENNIYTSKLEKQLLNSLNYKDGNIIIKNGKFEKIETDLVGSGSQFLTYIQFHHGQYMAIKIINEITHLSYKVNHVSSSTLLNNMFLKKEQKEYLKQINQQRIKVLQSIMYDLYNGRMAAPAGFDLNMWFNKVYGDRLYDDEKLQQTKLLEYIKIPTANFLNKYYTKEINKVVSAVSHIGQQFDQGRRMSSDKYYKRTIVSYPKFQPSPESEGYILGNFYDGLSQKEMFMHAAASRRETYIKGNTTAVGGYLGRRLNQGAGNMYAKPNGIIASSGGQIISLQYGSSGYNPRNYIVIKFDKHKIPMEEFEAQYKDHPKYKEMLQIRNDIIINEEILKQSIPKYVGSNELVVPFKFDQDDITEEELDRILTCRLCSKMSDGMKEIIIAQSYMFYIYALFFLKINKDSTHKIIDKYLQSLVQIGEPVGIKAALACSQPYTQSLLSAIHTKGGMMTVTQEEFTSGVTRFQELVTGNKGPSVISFQLLGKAKYDIEKNIKFISDNQTLKFTNLKPQILIFQSSDKYAGYQKELQQSITNIDVFEKASYSKYIIKLTFAYKQLAYYLIDIWQMMQNIIEENPTQIKMIVPFDQGDNLVMFMYFDNNILKQQVSMIKNQMMTTLQLGSRLFYNLYFDPPGELKEGQSYKIVGNITNSKHETQKDALLNIYSIPGIDANTIYCSDPRQYYKYCGIVKTRLSLYTELYLNLVSDSSTKAVQGTHVRLICDLLSQSGELTSFTRNSYRKEGQRDLYSLLLFEQGDVFLANELQNPHLQIINTSLNSCIFGTDSEQGTTVSQILFDGGVKKQDQEKLEALM